MAQAWALKLALTSVLEELAWARTSAPLLGSEWAQKLVGALGEV